MKLDDLLKLSIGLHRLEHCQKSQDCPRKKFALIPHDICSPELPRLSFMTFDRVAFLWPSTGITYLTIFHLHFMLINHKVDAVTLYYSLLGATERHG